MHDNSSSTNRRAEEYVLFALAFVGFVIAASGLIVSAAGVAAVGAITLLFSFACFLLGSSSKA